MGRYINFTVKNMPTLSSIAETVKSFFLENPFFEA